MGVMRWLAERLGGGDQAPDGPLVAHAIPAIFEHWERTHVRPLLEPLGADDTEQFFVRQLLDSAKRSGSPAPRFLSLDAGTCDLELQLAVALRQAGLGEFNIECVELSPLKLARARATALARGLARHVTLVRADTNTWRAKTSYDGVLGRGGLDRVQRLERLLDEVQRALADGASFVVSSRIGRNGHRCWPEALAEVQRFFEELPIGHRWNHLLRRSEMTFVDHDQSRFGQGLRAQDVLPQLLARFSMPLFAGYGGAIEAFVSAAMGPNLSPQVARDRDFIARVHDNDEALLQAGQLTPTRMLAVLTAGDSGTPAYARGLAPASCVRAPAR